MLKSRFRKTKLRSPASRRKRTQRPSLRFLRARGPPQSISTPVTGRLTPFWNSRSPSLWALLDLDFHHPSYCPQLIQSYRPLNFQVGLSIYSPLNYNLITFVNLELRNDAFSALLSSSKGSTISIHQLRDHRLLKAFQRMPLVYLGPTQQ